MLCRQCGTEIADRALICYRCGTATTEAKYKPPPLPSGPRRMWAPIVAIVILILGILAGWFLSGG